MSFAGLDRITVDPEVMGGKPYIRGMRVTVEMIVGLIASGCTMEEILKEYPYIERDDIGQCLKYASLHVGVIDVPSTDEVISGTAENLQKTIRADHVDTLLPEHIEYNTNAKPIWEEISDIISTIPSEILNSLPADADLH